MSYKIKKIVKKVTIFKDEKKYILANDITMDEWVQNIDGMKINYLIAWFDKTKNPDLTGNLSKVQFGVSEVSPASATWTQETEDVDFASMYKSNEDFTEEQIISCIQDHARVIDVADFEAFPVLGYDQSSIVVPEGFSTVDTVYAKITLDSVSIAPTHFVFAWVNKTNVIPTEDKEEIITLN